MGRFISEDPARDGYNWYGYAGQNPVKYVDPNGQNEEDYQRFESVCQKIGGIIGAGKGYLKGAAIGALITLPKAPWVKLYSSKCRHAWNLWGC